MQVSVFCGLFLLEVREDVTTFSCGVSWTPCTLNPQVPDPNIILRVKSFPHQLCGHSSTCFQEVGRSLVQVLVVLEVPVKANLKLRNDSPELERWLSS